MVDKNLIKTLRHERAWSQEQLAAISGLSLRTIQRIENDGSCSLESIKALAATFEIDICKLKNKPATTMAAVYPPKMRGLKYALAGSVAGLAGAYAGITASLLSGDLTSHDAGVYYGATAAFCGFCCALAGVLSRRITGMAG